MFDQLELFNLQAYDSEQVLPAKNSNERQIVDTHPKVEYEQLKLNLFPQQVLRVHQEPMRLAA